MATVQDNFLLPWQHSVCQQCLDVNPYAIWLVKYGCLDSNGHECEKAVVVIDHESMKLIRTRKPPRKKDSPTMCKKLNTCSPGNRCLDAHSKHELICWLVINATNQKRALEACGRMPHSLSDVCKECFTLNPNAVWLSWLTCTNKTHGDTGRVTVVMSRDRKSLVKVRQMERSLIDLCKQKDKCRNREACTFAHSEEELSSWRWRLTTENMIKEPQYHGCTVTELCEKYSYPAKDSDVLLSGVRGPLSCDTYKEKYHKLVFLDNLEHARKMVADCDGDVTIDRSQKHGQLSSGEVHIVGMDSTAMDYAYQKPVPCRAAITFNNNGRANTISGIIKAKQENALVVLVSGDTNSLPQRAHVHFEYSHWEFKRLHCAIDLAKPSLIRRLVGALPGQSQGLPDMTHVAKQEVSSIEIDKEYQPLVLRKMLLCRPGSPFLLLGPFGTGKTHLIAAAVIKLVKAGRHRILVCTHHNRGANQMRKKIVLEPGISQDEVVRLHPNHEDSRIFGGVSVPDVSISNLCSKSVLVTTFMTALKLKDKDKRGELKFTHIFIDEGAQSRETEALGALLMADNDTHIIIAGDNKQVGPAASVLSELARQNGLGESIIERLLPLYKKGFNKKELDWHRYSLLANYRCHQSILMLASSLFYSSTLESRSDSEAHPDAPFPLVFECSSLKRDDNEISSPVNKREAEILVKKALEFVQSWPVEKSGNKPRVAILAGSDSQVVCLRSEYKKECGEQGVDSSKLPIQITLTYTIQGSEFDGVFLSTHEPTDKDGRPRNVVRSICNEYVFNTVITRSRSLVVAVGNPFLLHQMGSHFPVNCWAEYIQRCIACQSLHLLEAPEAQNDELSQIVSSLLDNVIPISQSDQVKVISDESTEGYEKLFLSQPKENLSKKLVQNPKDVIGTRVWRSDPDDETVSRDVVEAELHLLSHRKGKIISDDPEISGIEINSSTERRCIMMGGMILIDRATKEIVVNSKTERDVNEKFFGYSFLCRVNPENMTEFYPHNKIIPVINNMPMLTREMKDGVMCFEPDSISNRPKVNNFIPKECAVRMVFVVTFLRWRKKCRHPLGITIRALPCGNSVYSGDLLLRIAHDVSTADTRPSMALPVASDNRTPDNVCTFSSVITIDPVGSKDHDDALSCDQKTLKRGMYGYEFGVHITDVQKFVPKDSELDIIALKKGCSVYSSSDKCVSHMLPDPIVQEASILPRQTRDAFSVIARVSIRDKKIVGPIGAVEIVKSRITSTLEMTYEEAHTSLFADDGSKKLKILWLVACHLRRERLGSAAAAAHISVSSLDEILHPEAHMLVEEMMIWANTAVAKKLLDHFPSIVRRQPKPKDDDMEALVKAHGRNMAVSLDLQQHVPKGQRSYRSVQVLHETIREIENTLSEGSVKKALHCVQFEHLQPQVAVTHALFNMMRGRASYCVPSDEDSPDNYSHDSLKCDQYTRFTSPIRRYVDLTVQRMLLAALQDEDNPYAEEVEKVQEICQTVKEREREADKYEDGHKSLELACELQQSSREYLCFVKKTEEGRLFLTFSDPALKSINRDVTTVHLKHLNATSIPQKESSPLPEDTPGDTVHLQNCTWLVKFVSAQGTPNNFLAHRYLQNKFNRHDSTAAKATVSVFTLDDHENVRSSDISEQTLRLAIRPFTHSVPESNWRQMQRCLDPDVPVISTSEMKKLLVLPSCQAPSTFPSISHSPLWIYKLHRPLQTCEVIKIQMSGSFRTKTQIITPSIQLLEVGPNLQVCIQHNSNPTECFTDTSLAKPPKGGHKSMKDYFLY